MNPLKEKLNELKNTVELANKQINELEQLIQALENAEEKPKQKPLSKPATIYLNAGHGGLDAQGNYRTFPEHGKFYQFTDTKDKVYETAYEGVLNRQYASMLEKKLLDAGFQVVRTYDEVLDRTNLQRTNIANFHWQNNNRPRSCWVSIHFNASGMTSKGIGQTARGACIYTLNGQNQSDLIAEQVWKKFKILTKDFKITYREDLTDGDADHEAGFEEFNLTAMPAYLMETLFFDNFDDFQIAKKYDFMDAVTNAHLHGLLQYFNNIA